MGSLKFNSVEKIYPGGVHAVKDFNLEIEDKEFIVFVGPSGCGKSTILRMIAGLEEITDGQILIDDQVVNQLLPKDRDISMVFQNYALYPHMTVYENIAIGLKLRKVNKAEIDKRVRTVAKSIEIDELLDRKPNALSGGQQQRVALARAIVKKPNLFLMDEPLSNLDAKLRVQMRGEIIELHKKLETTFIYVTHDQVEAMTMGTRIVVMKDGVMQQVDSPMELYEKPVNMFVASFIGTPQMNFIEVELVEKSGRVVIKIDEGNEIYIEDYESEFRRLFEIESKYILGIRPEHISLEKGTKNVKLKGNISIVEQLGAETLVHVNVANFKILLSLPYIYSGKSGEEVSINLNPQKIFLFNRESEIVVFNGKDR